MAAPAVRGIDLFKIAGRSISGWVPSHKTGNPQQVRQPFCSQLEERLLLYLEYHPDVAWYARGDISVQFAQAYRLPTPKDAPFAIGYEFQGSPHHYLPDVIGTLTDGQLLIAEAGMEDEKRRDRQQAKAEAARRLAHFQRGVYWLGTEQTLSRQRRYNLVALHARRQPFPTFAAIEAALREVWPWGEVACVEELRQRLPERWPAVEIEAAIWKVIGDAAARGHLLLDLATVTLDRQVPLALLPPEAAPLCLTPCQTPSIRASRRWNPLRRFPCLLPHLQVAPLTPIAFQRRNESAFYAICGRSSRCSPERPSPRRQQPLASRARRWGAWCSARKNSAKSPVCPTHGMRNEVIPDSEHAEKMCLPIKDNNKHPLIRRPDDQYRAFFCQNPDLLLLLPYATALVRRSRAPQPASAQARDARQHH